MMMILLMKLMLLHVRRGSVGGHLSSTQLVFSLTHVFPDSFLGDLFKLAKDFLFTGDWRRKTRHPASS